MKARIFILSIAGALALVSNASAGDRSNVRGTGMARTYVVDSRSIDALGINPANLALEDRLPFTLALPQVGFRISSELISYDAYNKYFTGIPDPQNPGRRVPYVLTDQDKRDLLDMFPDNGATRADVEVTALGMSIQLGRIGSLGFAVTDHIGAQIDLPKQYMKVFLFGFDSSGSSYNFNGTSASAWWWREMNFSYANKLPFSLPILTNTYFGVGLKIIQGYGAMVTDHYSGSLANLVDPVGHQVQLQAGFDFLTKRSGANIFQADSGKKTPDFNNMKPFPEPAGKGTGFDLGLNGEIGDNFRFGISITDIGKIAWDQNLIETYGSYNALLTDVFDSTQQASLKHGFRGANRPGGSFATALPTKLRIGMAFQTKDMPILHYFPGNMLMEVDYNQGLNTSLGNTTTPRLSVGTEWRLIPILPLRTGITVGGGDQFRWSFGFGLDIWAVSIDVGTENFGMFFTPKSFTMASAAAGLRIRL
jgi:hypothetical protein